ncbi:MAG TPA: bifunctional hydroxymethylpyrimidine kinase/phosphomethylpyrimidine kinase, partial [Mycobacteriales bacterium]
MVLNILSIAGSDPSGGAGVQADLKTFAALGVYGMAAITALTVQNTRGVRAVHPVDAEVVAAQVEAVLDDVRVDAVKIGMLGDAAVIAAVAGVLRVRRPPVVVLDPVLVATSGDVLLAGGAVPTLLAELLPLADLVTPNVP